MSLSRSEQKVVQYLDEAHQAEVALVGVLKTQIAVAPDGSYRRGLEKHLVETRNHADRVHARQKDIAGGSGPLQAVVGVVETVVGQAVALGKTPLDLVRGTGGEEKILKNAKDAVATEALEIATYTALEELADAVGDTTTARLAASIRKDEERMLEALRAELPALTRAVVDADVLDNPTYTLADTGAADAVRAGRAAAEDNVEEAAATAKKTAKRATSKAKKAASEAKDAAEDAAEDARSAAKSTAKDAKAKARKTAKDVEATAKDAAEDAKDGADEAATKAKATARQARKVPGVAQAEGVAKGAVASEDDLAIKGYDDLNVDDIATKLRGLPQIDLTKIDVYERKNENRTTVTDRIASLRGDEPWPGYDEQTAAAITKALKAGNAATAKKVKAYESAHKDRAGVQKAADQAGATA